MGRFILLFFVIVAAVLFVNWLLKEDPKKVARYLRRGALWFAVIAVILLAATGRLNWIFAVFAAALPFLNRLAGLLRYLPLASHLYSQVQNARTANAYRSAAGQAGQTSQVSSRFLRMILEHETGNMDGEIVDGDFKGKRLSELDLDQLKQLLRVYQQSDEESFALLQAYLDRVYADKWREPGAQQESAAVGGGPMTEHEAREVLGVAEDASEEDVINAHRRLMQKMHPDRGGSTYLAAKINQAKDILLDT